MIETIVLLLLFFGLPLFLAFLKMTVKIVKQYQQGVKLTLGKFSGLLKPGLHIILPIIDKVYIVDTRITTVDIPKQEVITKDNVSVFINAVIYMRVEDPVKAVLKIRDYFYAVAQYGQTALRDVIGNVDLDELLTNRTQIADEIKRIVDMETAEWGVDISSIKIQDITLPENMKRAMARQAEAERERRGIVIKSEGEINAAKNLTKAAELLAKTPGALHLRTLQTLSDISGDPSGKYVIFLPIEVLKAFEGLSNKNKQLKNK